MISMDCHSLSSIAGRHLTADRRNVAELEDIFKHCCYVRVEGVCESVGN